MLWRVLSNPVNRNFNFAESEKWNKIVFILTPKLSLIIKKMLSVLKKAEKLFKEICEKKEGINCHSCPLNIEKHSDLGEFQICLFFGLNNAIKTLKKEIKTAEIEVKNE